MRPTTYINIFLLIFIMPMAWCGSVSGDPLCVVIDAGHGGKDPGAVHGKNYEKHINLAVALELGRLIDRELPDVKVVYTRDDDRFIELSERTRIANAAHADLFVSIHTNSAEAPAAYGTETYIMGVNKSNANLSVAMRENGVVSLEADYTQRYEGYDPNSAESFIIFSLLQYSYTEQSLHVASMIQKEFATTAARKNLGVKQGSFLVLWRTSMPSILTELGFISNPTERQFLLSEQGQRSLARSLFNAVSTYLKDKKQTPITSTPNVAKPKITTPKTQIQPAPKANNNEVCYKIQIRSTRDDLTINSGNFGGYVMRVEKKKTANLYKFYIGNAVSYKEALILQTELRKTFPDCFPVAFYCGEQITLERAKQLTQ